MNQQLDLIEGTDGLCRCWWCAADPQYRAYHDHEWGRPITDERTLFEKICLEGFQAGLSWITILKKREAFRKAFSNFEAEAVARYRPTQVDKLLQNAGIVRHRKKIESAVNNARQTLQIQQDFGSLASFVWQFVPEKRTVLKSRKGILAQTPESTAMAKAFKKRGFSFLGPTTCYAFMQAMGMVNDHLQRCSIWQQVDQDWKQFRIPQL